MHQRPVSIFTQKIISGNDLTPRGEASGRIKRRPVLYVCGRALAANG
jgi:hypothetical protein